MGISFESPVRAETTCAPISTFLKLLSFFPLQSELLSHLISSLLFGGLIFLLLSELIAIGSLGIESSVAGSELLLVYSIRFRKQSESYEHGVVWSAIEVAYRRLQRTLIAILLELTLRLSKAYNRRDAFFGQCADHILSSLIGIGAQSGSAEVSRWLVMHLNFISQLASFKALPGRACDRLITLLEISLICCLHIILGVAELQHLPILTRVQFGITWLFEVVCHVSHQEPPSVTLVENVEV